MNIEPHIKQRLIRNALLSLLIYALPPLLMFLTLYLRGSRAWELSSPVTGSAASAKHLPAANFHGYGFLLFIIILGLVEFSFGLYGHKWTRNEKMLDLACFALPKLVFAPFFAWFSLAVLPFLLPHQHNSFAWVPFFWGVLILCIADDLTQYWYHRVHHEIPWLWRFHRTHHSAPYMGMSMAGRQNAFYSIFFSQTYLTSILVYLGLGPAAVVVLGVKSTITTLAHSSIPWDKPFYRYPALHPVAWVRAADLYPRDPSCSPCFEFRRWCGLLQRKFWQHVFSVGCPLRYSPHLSPIPQRVWDFALSRRPLARSAPMACFQVQHRRQRARRRRSGGKKRYRSTETRSRIRARRLAGSVIGITLSWLQDLHD